MEQVRTAACPPGRSKTPPFRSRFETTRPICNLPNNWGTIPSSFLGRREHWRRSHAEVTLVLFGGAITVSAFTSSINATPLSDAARSLAGAAAASDQILKVHGFHRGCRWDRPDGGAKSWHRHVGPTNRRVAC